MSDFIKTLERWVEQQKIEAIDLEWCRFLHQQDAAVGDEVLKAAFLATNRYRQGDVCISLKEYANQPLLDGLETDKSLKFPSFETWKDRLIESSFTGMPGAFTPLILDSGRLYLQKLWQQEQTLAHQIRQRAQHLNQSVDYEAIARWLNQLFPVNNSSQPDGQKVAATMAALQQLTVISGGPGTGKTTTVVRILTLLIGAASDQPVEIALAAPTGKAAARLKKSISTQQATLPVDPAIIEQIPEQTFTLHRLLGARRQSHSFKYNEDNPLPYDVVVVDEVSMADQRLIHRLLQALKPETKLILLGDKDQLASVEAGAVLGDICGRADNRFTPTFCASLQKLNITLDEWHQSKQVQALADNVVLLKQNYRYDADSGIHQLTVAIKNGEAETVVALLEGVTYREIDLRRVESFEKFWKMVRSPLEQYFKLIDQQASSKKLFEQLKQFKVLCAHRRGAFSVDAINRGIEKRLRKEGMGREMSEWYSGRPVIIRQNNYSLGLRNGDIGICRRNEQGDWIVVFPSEERSQEAAGRTVYPAQLPQYDTAFALTIHQSQGSEFDEVAIVLPDEHTPLLTRELLYTAVSRARETVRVVTSKRIIKAAVENKTSRSSGLMERLWNDRD